MADREIGIVKWYDKEEGNGYIARKRGADIYVHHSAVRCDSVESELREGAAVEFSVSVENEETRARDVVILS